jgi:hypothetical protein
MQLIWMPGDKEQVLHESAGTGFIINDGVSAFYLVSAAHVLKQVLRALLPYEGRGYLRIFFTITDPQIKKKTIVTYNLDVIDAWKSNALKFHRDASVDVGILKLRKLKYSREGTTQERSITSQTEPAKVDPATSKPEPEVHKELASVNIVEQADKYEAVRLAGTVYFLASQHSRDC